ncbi:hypothetical protein DFH09DRAFT_1083351 [Mycena vulgaris]|nr:hypothetical protein DFH09DRAFT_1083351 [Mycena vulgaris]
MLACVVLGGDGVSLQHPRRVRNTRKPVSRLSEQTGLPSRQTGLQADLPGLGALIYTQIQAQARTSPLAQAQARFAKPKIPVRISPAERGARSQFRIQMNKIFCFESREWMRSPNIFAGRSPGSDKTIVVRKTKGLIGEPIPKLS